MMNDDDNNSLLSQHFVPRYTGGANPKSLGAARSNVEPPLHQSLVKVMQGIAKSQLNIPNTELFLIPPPRYGAND